MVAATTLLTSNAQAGSAQTLLGEFCRRLGLNYSLLVEYVAQDLYASLGFWQAWQFGSSRTRAQACEAAKTR